MTAWVVFGFGFGFALTATYTHIGLHLTTRNWVSKAVVRAVGRTLSASSIGTHAAHPQPESSFVMM